MAHIILISMIIMAFLSQAQDQEIYPAKIYADIHKLEFKCSTYGLKEKENSNVYIYLCRNGIGIDRKPSCTDAIFYIDDTTKHSTGNYSCLFSVYEFNLELVRGNGINSIFITVNDSFIPAEIASPQTSVKTGSEVEFQCSSEYMSPERNQKGNIYAYLSKNSTVIQMTIWDSVKNKARFTLKEVTRQDAGTYICFLMSEHHSLPKKVHGINEVNLHITDGMIHLIAIVPLAALLLVGVLFIIIYRNRKMINDKLCQNHGQSNEPANMRNDEGLKQVIPTMTSHESYRNEIYNDMQEYATIPEVGGVIKPLTTCVAEGIMMYNLDES